MTTPALPPHHALLPPDFLRQHGAVKGMLRNTWMNPDCWVESKRRKNTFDSKYEAEEFLFCAPLGTIAAATTPVPEGRCNCPFVDEGHAQLCPAHPRNAYVHILPHLLAQLSEKPEGLLYAEMGKADWEPFLHSWEEYLNSFAPDAISQEDGGPYDLAFCLPRHVFDRIEHQLRPWSSHPIHDEMDQMPEDKLFGEQLSTKGGDEPCPISSQRSSGSNAAPERSQPSQEAAPSDTEMLDWLEKNHKFATVALIYAGHSSIRSAITAAMKEDRK